MTCADNQRCTMHIPFRRWETLALTNQPFAICQKYCLLGKWQEQLAGTPVKYHYCYYHHHYHLLLAGTPVNYYHYHYHNHHYHYHYHYRYHYHCITSIC